MITFLQNDYEPYFQVRKTQCNIKIMNKKFEAARCLSIFFQGRIQHVEAIVRTNAIPCFIRLLKSPIVEIANEVKLLKKIYTYYC